MKFSEAWLREWVNPDVTTDELVAQLTMAGLEVDAVEDAAEILSGVVVGEIVSVEQHPDADKLQVCVVKGHQEGEKQVVCGAPNARVGIKVPFATVGAVLPDNFKIKKAKLRGVESFGMLCGQTELNLGDDDSGLWELPLDAPVGSAFNDYLLLNDKIIEVDLTPNRADCLSIAGIAREVATLNRSQVKDISVAPVEPAMTEQPTVDVQASSACPRYAGRIINNIDISKPTPLWMVERLRRSDIRSIDAVVDITNYVMLELGQPMHAFDLETLEGGIIVRFADQDEKLVLLDGSELKLNDDTLVIADHKKPLALAGIMGGEHSGCSSNTKSVLLESAFFSPEVIAGKARRYGLHTDSSHRFERGVDFNLQVKAIERATQLLIEVCGGEAGPVVDVSSEQDLPTKAPVTLNKKRLDSALGCALGNEEVTGILSRLGLEPSEQGEGEWLVSIPSYRFDISIEADLVEELARVYGYDKLPIRALSIQPTLQRNSEVFNSLTSIKRHLASRDYHEAITYSFIDPKLHEVFFPGQQKVELLNPISADLSSMRTSLIPGLVDALSKNIKRQQSRVRVFESGLCFNQGESAAIDDLIQEERIAALAYGPLSANTWDKKSDWVDFYDLKGDVESLLGFCTQGRKISFRPGQETRTWMHPGQCAEVFLDGQCIGYLGALHPSTLKALDIEKNVYVMELALAAIKESALPAFKGISKFPAVSRDLAFVIDQSVSYEEIQSSVRASAGQSLTSVTLFDVYKGENIGEGKQSIALNLTFQEIERTLKDEEVNAALDQVVASLAEEFQASLR